MLQRLVGQPAALNVRQSALQAACNMTVIEDTHHFILESKSGLVQVGLPVTANPPRRRTNALVDG